MEAIRDYPNLTSAMQQASWTENRIRKIMGANWLCLLEAVWGK